MKSVATYFAALVGCDVVGIRLQDRDDYPADPGSSGANPTRPPAAAGDADGRAETAGGGEGYESVAVIPLRLRGRVLGLVRFSDKRPGVFTADTVAALERLADHVAFAVAKLEAEEALRTAEEKYRIVADSTYDWEFWVTLDGRVLYMSPSCERVSGYSVDAFRRDATLRRRLVAPDHLRAWDRHHLRCHVTGTPGSLVFRIVRADGESRWIEHVCQPAQDEAGRLLGIRASNRDITARRVAEEARDRAEAEREALIGQLAEAIAHVKTLRGFIPICSACKKIRDDAGYWQAVEVYVRDHTEAQFSHGLCPACLAELYPDYVRRNPAT